MAKNQYFGQAQKVSVVCSNPTTPASGDVVRFGNRIGVALESEGTDGYTSVDFGPGGWKLAVSAVTTNIVPSTPLYYHDGSGANKGTINNTAIGGYFFGYSNGSITAAATDTIEVHKVEDSAPVQKTRLLGGFLKVKLVDGGAAGNITVSGIAVGDEIVFVGNMATKSSIATMADVTSEFSITAADTINNGGGSNTTSNQLMVMYLDLTA